MTKRLVVIGGVAAGMSAAAKAKRVDREMDVVVYERGPFVSYGACGMPYLIAGDIPDYRSLIARTPEQMAKQGVQVHLRHEVTAVDADARTVTVRDLTGEREFVQSYDQLVIATGAGAIRLPIPGEVVERAVKTQTNKKDNKSIKEKRQAPGFLASLDSPVTIQKLSQRIMQSQILNLFFDRFSINRYLDILSPINQ